MAQTPQGPAAAHPASVNRFLEANGFLVYHEKVRLSRVYLRDSTLVSGLPLLLFGGDIEVHHSQQLLTLDDWIKFKVTRPVNVTMIQVCSEITHGLVLDGEPYAQLLHLFR